VDQYLIITAAGSGTRMKNSVPKQFLKIGEKPIVMHTIQKFYNTNTAFQIILVLSKDQTKFWKNLCKKYNFNIPHVIAYGGSERFYSIKNALEKVPNNSMVMIHDAVRPLISSKLINRIMDIGKYHDATIPVLPIKDSIRKIENELLSISVNRSGLFSVQTPQYFKSELIKSAYKQKFKSTYTDDASVFESLQKNIFCVEGDELNIKLTTKKDLKIIETFLYKDL